MGRHAAPVRRAPARLWGSVVSRPVAGLGLAVALVTAGTVTSSAAADRTVVPPAPLPSPTATSSPAPRDLAGLAARAHTVVDAAETLTGAPIPTTRTVRQQVDPVVLEVDLRPVAVAL
ncbi:hypothetical protein, partial [Cellulomonas massiliensis]|uniref:hypothetical protein n=1 Tax=Cellulomonas massiliensis TaxID=1465811 RepID=UPI00058D554E